MSAGRGTSGAGPVFRPPLLLRIYVAAFSCVWCAALLVAAVRVAAHGKPAIIVLLAVMLAFGLTLGLRLLRMSVALEPDALVVRNLGRTRSLLRQDIEGFRSGPVSHQPFGRTVYALLRDGSICPLDVASRLHVVGAGRTSRSGSFRPNWWTDHTSSV